MITILLIYLLIGCVAGLVAGLFGLGGGVVIVPALLFSFSYLVFDPSVITHLAIGTSLATIVATSLSAIYAHHQRGAVEWLLVAKLTPGVLVGAWLGAQFASSLDAETLRRAFAVFLLLVAVKMALALKPKAEASLPQTGVLALVGAVIGAVSALFGIGGGTLTVPFLSWCSVVMQRAVATAAAVGLPIALAGALGYLFSGWQHVNLPEGATGYIYWPAFAGVVVSSTFTARIGVKLAHTLPARKLQLCFALLMAVVGIRFLL